MTRAGGEPRVFPVLQTRSVSLSAKLSITPSIITYVVNNVKRYGLLPVCMQLPRRHPCEAQILDRLELVLRYRRRTCASFSSNPRRLVVG